jgi:hypothetical protein
MTKKSPNKLSKTGKKAGVALSEKQLDKVAAGRAPVKIKG